MGFRNGAYASVFAVKKGKGNWYDVNLVINKKGQDGNYVRDFNGFAMFIGDAATVIGKYDGQNAKDNGNRPLARIKLDSVDVSNSYNSEKKTTYTTFKVFNCEEIVQNGQGSQSGKTSATKKTTTRKTASDYANDVGGAEEMPFT